MDSKSSSISRVNPVQDNLIRNDGGRKVANTFYEKLESAAKKS
jgi:hypothetical protein